MLAVILRCVNMRVCNAGLTASLNCQTYFSTCCCHLHLCLPSFTAGHIADVDSFVAEALRLRSAAAMVRRHPTSRKADSKHRLACKISISLQALLMAVQEYCASWCCLAPSLTVAPCLQRVVRKQDVMCSRWCAWRASSTLKGLLRPA